MEPFILNYFYFYNYYFKLMETFTNSIVEPDHLPQIDSGIFNPISKKYLKIILIRIALIFIIPVIALVILYFVSEEKPPNELFIISFSVLLFLCSYSSLISILGFKKRGYLVRDKDISYQLGLISYKLTTVTFNRIQHVELNQGILSKILKLSSLKVFTAGGNASDLSIPGLPQEDAQKLKVFLSEKISLHE